MVCRSRGCEPREEEKWRFGVLSAGSQGAGRQQQTLGGAGKYRELDSCEGVALGILRVYGGWEFYEMGYLCPCTPSRYLLFDLVCTRITSDCS